MTCMPVSFLTGIQITATLDHASFDFFFFCHTYFVENGWHFNTLEWYTYKNIYFSNEPMQFYTARFCLHLMNTSCFTYSIHYTNIHTQPWNHTVRSPINATAINSTAKWDTSAIPFFLLGGHGFKQWFCSELLQASILIYEAIMNGRIMPVTNVRNNVKITYLYAP